MGWRVPQEQSRARRRCVRPSRTFLLRFAQKGSGATPARGAGSSERTECHWSPPPHPPCPSENPTSPHAALHEVRLGQVRREPRLRRHHAQSGKRKGQFYTPAEVSRIMAQGIAPGRFSSRRHDPGCAIGCAPRFNRRCLRNLPRGGPALVGDDGQSPTWTQRRPLFAPHSISRFGTNAEPQVAPRVGKAGEPERAIPVEGRLYWSTLNPHRNP